jgi:hypothetical protein
MRRINGIFIVRSIANTVNTINESDDLILKEKDETLLNDLQRGESN